MITGAQIRAARALLGWSQAKLAAHIEMRPATLNAIEAGGNTSTKNIIAIERAFAEAGVLFLEPGVNRDGGAGVRMKEK